MRRSYRGNSYRKPKSKRYRATTQKRWKRRISGAKEIIENAASFVPGIGETQAMLGIVRGIKKMTR